MKKILFVTNHLQYSDGVAQALLNLVNNLDESRYEVSICALFRLDRDFIKQFKSNIKIFSIFHGYFKGLSKILKFIPKNILLKKVVKQHYDVVVAYQFGYPTELLSSPHITTKKIAFMHGYDTSSIKYHNNYNKIICVAESSAINYSKLFEFKDKITYCHNILENDNIMDKSLENEDLKKDFASMQKPVICFVGRLSEEKGIERTLNAFSKIKKDGLSFSYLIIGDGGLKNSIQKQIEELNLEENVKMYGFQKNPYKYMALSDAYLCSSFSEGLSTTSIEASILGLDILSTEVSGAKEIVLNPDIGIVCENSFEGIYDCLKEYISTAYPNNLWKDNKELAKEKWKKEYNLKRFDDLICEVVE